MNKKFIQTISTASAIAICSYGTSFAAAAAPVSINTDLRLTGESTVTIVDQQSPVLNGSGSPVIDSNGNEETYDVTSVNLDLFYTYGDFATVLRDGIANQGVLGIGVEPAGFCTYLASGGMRPADETSPFDIPLGELRMGPGLPPLLTTYMFQGLTGPEFGQVKDAIEETVALGDAPAPIPPADSQGGFEGTPYANMTLSLTALNAGELTLDGIIDLSELLGVPQGKVDLVVAYGEPDSSNSDGVPPDYNTTMTTGEAACLANVTPTVTIVPVGSQPQPLGAPQ
jgi:hypothetical protein